PNIRVEAHPPRCQRDGADLVREPPHALMFDRDANRSVGRGRNPNGLQSDCRDLYPRLPLPVQRFRDDRAPRWHEILPTQAAFQGVTCRQNRLEGSYVRTAILSTMFAKSLLENLDGTQKSLRMARLVRTHNRA